MLEILEGHRRRSGGQVSVLGVDPQSGGRAFRERIGIVLQSAGIDAELTVSEVMSLNRIEGPAPTDDSSFPPEPASTPPVGAGPPPP